MIATRCFGYSQVGRYLAKKCEYDYSSVRPNTRTRREVILRSKNWTFLRVLRGQEASDYIERYRL